MSKLKSICLLSAALLALASMPAAPAAQWTGASQRQGVPVSWDELSRTRWIADGRDDAPRKIYVFMDANCKYCVKFWSDARPWVDSGKVQLRHIMVAVIAPTSAGKAATLMLDPDPARRLASYERAHAFGVARAMTGGPRHGLDDPNLPPTTAIPPEIYQALESNDTLMRALGLQGTPGIVFRGLDGKLQTRPGISPEDLPRVLGAL